MNVVCVYSVDAIVASGRPFSSYASIPFGISYVAASLRQAGHEPTALVVSPRTDLRKVLGDLVRQSAPRLFCLTAVSTQYPRICEVARIIKQIDPSIYVLLGGHHVTLNPDEAIGNPDVDAICIGEGEVAAVRYADQIADRKEPSGIHNLWIKSPGGGHVERNPQDRFTEDLDALPPIDRSMWDRWVTDKNGMASVLLGRDCPNRCTYCSNHALAKISEGRYVRFRSPQSITGELRELLTSNPKIDTVYLEVETFQANLRFTHDMCEELERFVAGLGRPVNFGVNLVVAPKPELNAELLQALKRSHFDFVNIGLESGCERVRKDVLNRPRYANSHVIEFCRLARRQQIKIGMYVLVGLPGENVRDFRETIQCVRRCDPHSVHLSIFYPYPGTRLYDKARQMGAFTGRMADPSSERKTATLSFPGFSRRQIRREYVLFPYKAHRGKRPLRQILIHVIRNFLSGYPRLYSLYRKAVGLA